MQNISFQNYDCVALNNDKIQLIISRSIGPRILAINFHGMKNLLAELPDFTTQMPEGKPYHFYGGHRLWMAPEHMPLTYEYDDQPVEISETNSGLTISKPKERFSNMEKTLTIDVDPELPKVRIEHTLKNCGNDAVECAPWAITQFRTGGTAILPQNRTDTGFLPNRSVAIWPYTDVNDPNVKWGNDFIMLNAKVTSPFKVGFPNPRGWLAYWLDGFLFVKHAPFEAQATYYDLGSSSECYCNDQFLELETLGPKTILEPGETVNHVEIWSLYVNVVKPEHEVDANSLVECLGLEDNA